MMKPLTPRRCLLAAACAALIAPVTPAWAQERWPSQPIRVVNPYAAGGVVDILARLLTDKLAPALNATFIVEAKPGAAGNLGTDMVAQAKPDGYTWLIATTSNAANMALMKGQRTDLLRDLVPVAQFAVSPNYFVVPVSSPAKTLGEYVALAKSQPAKLSYGSAGTGSTPHLGFELLKYETGIDVLAVPYKGAPPIITDLASGQLSATLMPAVLAIAQAKTGKFRLLAVTSATRTKDLPDVPTMQEAGFGSAVVAPWFVVMVPSGTPQPIVSRIEAAVRDAVASPDLVNRIEGIGAQPAFAGQADSQSMIRKEIAKWHQVVKATGLQPN